MRAPPHRSRGASLWVPHPTPPPPRAAVSLLTVGNFVRAVAAFSTKAFARGGAWQAAVQPYAEAVKPLVDSVLGGFAATSGSGSAGASIAPRAEAVLLMALLIVAAGVWRALHNANVRAEAAATAVAVAAVAEERAKHD
jgi:hypothetical protein